MEELGDMVVTNLAEALIPLHKGHEMVVVDAGTCGDVVDRQFHLVRAKHRVAAEGVGDVVGLPLDPRDREAEV